MSAQSGGDARGRHLSEVLGTLLDRRVGRLTGEAGRSVSTAHTIALFGLVVTLSYVAFFMTYDMAGFATLIGINMAFTVLYVVCVLLARLGRQLGAALLTLGTGIAQLVIATDYVGWEAGLHLYLLMGGQLVYLVFTERQRGLRLLFAFLALSAFLFCQFMFPASEAYGELPPVLLNTLFSINALLTAGMLFTLAAVSHFRAQQARREADEAAARAAYLANTDALTGLANRRPVMERLEELSRPGGSHYCLAVADLDRFKEINDTFGHACGDRVLAEVGARLKSSLRVTDSVGRWGGEEFVFVMPEAEIADAVVTMERIRTTLGESPIACQGHDHPITVSIGLTNGQYDGSPHQALRRADDALYEAKAAGRDQVTVVEAETDDVDAEPAPASEASADDRENDTAEPAAVQPTPDA